MDKLLSARIRDKVNEAIRNYSVTAIGFLSPAEKAEAAVSADFGPCEFSFWGGYEEAERVYLFIRPQDFYPEFSDYYDEHIRLLRFSSYGEGPELGHRDYLGSLMGAGLKREAIGDILIYKDTKMQYCDILLSSGVASSILNQLTSVGRVGIRTEELPLSHLHIPAKAFREISDTVMSLRLDAVLSSAFSLSRANAKAAVEKGFVKRNDREELSPGRILSIGDTVSMRGQGKFILSETLGITKKDRIRIKIKRYL